MAHIKEDLPHRNISRIGVYGVARDETKMLLVVQSKGPYVNQFDLPGGGIEFGETVEQTLHREFLEEVGMDFTSMKLIENLTTIVEIPKKDRYSSYTFHQIGLIYSITGLIGRENRGSLQHDWIDIRTLKKEQVSPFAWTIMLQNVS